ncbi:MAG: HAMP domain-containing histidine kinase [Bryobacterales bacterium]|nr:HAMP domain-containing histidine kinase [Bryobacterales bacterium]
MNRLRNRLLLAFLLAALGPLVISLWVTSALLERSLSLNSTREIDSLSQALRATGRELYQQACENLRASVAAGGLRPERFPISGRGSWPTDVAAFHESGRADGFALGGPKGDQLEFLVRRESEVLRYTRNMAGSQLPRLAGMYTNAWDRVEETRTRDLRSGFLYPLLLIGAAGGVLTIVVLVFFAHRISKPVHQLTQALERLAAGDLSVRVAPRRMDEIGAAFEAFNRMADQLEHSRERLILLTRLSSWQALGRKMAHEVKNSLTPIRLTVEEMAARQPAGPDRQFFEQAAGIIVEEVNRLEKRVRAFSDLAAEPPVHFSGFDVNAVLEERTSFLRAAHPEVLYSLRLASHAPAVRADEDLVRGVLTNLLENAAEAAGPGGVVLGITAVHGDSVRVEVHDSGPGLSLHARETLFEPTISFKKAGMGLGLSIARKSALLSGGDIECIQGELGGAAFRLTLRLGSVPAAQLSETETAWVQSES